MKKLFIAFMFILLLPFYSYSKTITLFIINSFRNSTICNEQQIDGLKGGLQQYFDDNTHFIIWSYCLYPKYKAKNKQVLIQHIWSKIQQVKPDYIIINNEHAFRLMIKFLVTHGYNKRVIFSGVNKLFFEQVKQSLPKNTEISGVLYYIKLTNFFKMLMNNNYLPTKIYVVINNTLKSYFVGLNYINEIKHFNETNMIKLNYQLVKVNTVFDYKKFLYSINDKKHIIVFITFDYLKNVDFFTTVSQRYIIKLTQQYNNNIMIITDNPNNLIYGATFVISPSLFEEGYRLAYLLYSLYLTKHTRLINSKIYIYANKNKLLALHMNRLLCETNFKFIDFIFEQ